MKVSVIRTPADAPFWRAPQTAFCEFVGQGEGAAIGVAGWIAFLAIGVEVTVCKGQDSGVVGASVGVGPDVVVFYAVEDGDNGGWKGCTMACGSWFAKLKVATVGKGIGIVGHLKFFLLFLLFV
jgi:hypothetical protein